MPRVAPIEITARDRTGEAIKSANKNFEALVKGSPLQKALESLRMVSDRGRAIGGVSSAMMTLGGGSRLAAGGLGEAAGMASALGAGLGAAGAGALGLGAGLAVAGVAATKFEMNYSQVGAGIGRTAAAMGQSTYDLQKYEIAGHKAGVSTKEMDGAFQGLTSTMEDAASGRNRIAESLMMRMGIHIHRLKNGSIDGARAMDDLGHAMQRSNPLAREKIASTMGAASALQFLIQTDAQRQAQLDEAVRSGAIRTGKTLADDQRLRASLSGLGDAWHGMLNRMEEHLIIPWLQPTVDWLTKLLGVTSNIPGQAPGSAGKAAPNAPDQSGPSPLAGARSRFAQHWFESQGWSKDQAAGIVANLMRESGLNEHARGDHGRALGIGQWHADRQAAFAAWAGHSMTQASFDEQLRFFQYEITRGSRAGAGRKLASTQSAAEAAAVVSRYDEAPADAVGEATRRGALAVELAQNDASPAPPTQHTVEVRFTNAPPGTRVAVHSPAGAVQVAAIAPTLPGPSI